MAPVALTPTARSPVPVPSPKLSTMASTAPQPTPDALKSPYHPRPTERAPDSAPRAEFAFDEMEDALAAFAAGEFLVVMDDEGRENEGDLIVAASAISTEQMAWMIKYTSGYICIALPGERLDGLQIPMMVPLNEERHRTAYTVTVDYRHGTSTGISAHDRALTARALASSHAGPTDFARPGHMVPLRARSGGVLTRRGHTESGADLCGLVGLPKAGLLCELVNDDDEGSMMRRDQCRAFADRWGIKMISVEQLARYRAEREKAA